MTDAIRIKKFAESYFQKSGHTEFPTIRQTANKLRLRQAYVAEIVDSSGDMCTEYYNAKHSFGDRYIYVMDP